MKRRIEGDAASRSRSCVAMKKMIRSRPIKLATIRNSRSSGFITSKIIRNTATVPYLFIHGCRFMRSLTRFVRKRGMKDGAYLNKDGSVMIGRQYDEIAAKESK